MYGWLITNEFLKTEKFTELRDMFVEAAASMGITLEAYTNADFTVRADINDVDSVAFNLGAPDFVIFYDKDILLGKMLEEKGIRLYNSTEAISICDSKVKTMEKLAGKVRMPETYMVPFTYENIGLNLSLQNENEEGSRESFLDRIELLLAYPYVIKESHSSFGMGVHLVNNRQEAVDVLNRVGNKECLIQEYISSSEGKDVRIQMVGNKCVAAMYRYNNNNFISNITNGGEMKEYTPSSEQIDMAKKVMEALKLDFAGVDIMFSDDGSPIFCEVNSNAHFKNLYDCTGVDTAKLILEYIRNDVIDLHE